MAWRLLLWRPLRFGRYPGTRGQCLYSPVVRPFRFLLLIAVLGGSLLACSPTLNWREVRPEGVSLTMLLPCKPDRASKAVPLGGHPIRLSMTGCEAGGALFALAVAEVADPGQAAQVLAQWQSLTLPTCALGRSGLSQLRSAAPMLSRRQCMSGPEAVTPMGKS